MPGARVRTIRGGRTRRPWIHGLLAAIAMAALTSCSDDRDEHRATEAPHTARLAGSGSAAVRAPQDNDPGRFLLVDSWTATYSVRRGREWTSPLQERTSSTESGRGTLTLSDPYGRSGSWSGTGTYSGTFEGAVTRSDTARDGSVLTFTTRRLGAGTVDVSGSLSIDAVAGTYSVHFGQPLGIPGTFERSCDGFDVEWTDGVQEELVGAMVNPFLDFLCDERGATTMPGLGGGAVDQPLSASGWTLSGSATLPDGTDMAWTFVPEGERPVLRADAGGPYETSRGAEIRLDGSRSTGSIVGYEWTFAAGVDCPADAPFDAGARKAGETATVVALCSVEATLTVTDGVNTDTDPATLNVHPRIWETEFVGPRTRAQSDAEEQLLEQAMFENVLILATRDSTGQYDIAYRSGINVSAHTGLGDQTFDPPATGKPGSWEGKGYDIEQVNDPGGPFHGALHVGNYRMQLARRTLINPYLLAESDSGRRPLVYRNFFYAENRGRGGQVDDYLEAIRAHEYEHTTRMRDALAQVDPAERIEAVFGTDREELKRIVDGWIGEAEVKVCVASSDPLPGGEPWSGTLWYPTYDDATPWVSGPAAVNRRAPQNVSQREAACRG